MSHHVSEPSTPTRSAPRIDHLSANYSTPARARVSAVHLPPQELPQVISRFSSRRSSFSKNSSPRRVSARGSLLGSHHGSGPHSRSQSNMSSRPTTPNRRLSDHLSVRRRRRSSTGIFYDSGYVGEVTKAFLRQFSRTLVREKLHEDDPNAEVYRALDERQRLASISPAELPNEFDYSLPLPSDDGLDSPEPVVEIIPRSPVAPQKKVFKSYLERILETRSRKLSDSYRLTFDRASSGDTSRHEGVAGVINTSRFVIDNTLSGLPEFVRTGASVDSSLKLAEPVAFSNLQDAVSSNDSSEKETSVPPADLRMRPRTSSFELGNKTPVNYDSLKFESIDHLDVPSWEPVPIFEDDRVGASPDLNASPQLNASPEGSDAIENPGSDISQSGIISGHFTIENEDYPQDLDQYEELGEDEHSRTPPQSRPASPLAPGPIRRILASKPAQSTPGLLPNNLVKGCVSLVQRLPLHTSTSPPRKRKRTNRLPSATIQLVTSKSNEFLQQMMSDLSAYAAHRGSEQINMADAILYLKRTRAHSTSAKENGRFLKLSQSIFPLEHMISLDNSLQKATAKAAASSKAVRAALYEPNLAYDDAMSNSDIDYKE